MRESTRVPIGHKWCNIGLHVKPLTEFGRNSQRLDGYMGACRECVNEANRQSYWRVQGRQKPPAPAPVPAGHKRCSKGGHVKPLSEFTKRPDQPGKYKSACRECINTANRKPPPSPVQPGHKRCKTGHVKPLTEFARRADGHGDGYESMCRECYRQHRRECYQDPEWRRRQEAAKARWIAKNPNYYADYYLGNQEKFLAYAAEYRKTHPPIDPERQREYGRAWYDNNPEKAREKARRSNSRRRARLCGLPYERYTLDEILERDGTTCVLCDAELALDEVFPHPLSPTVEHLECISWPDSAGDVFSNVSAAHARCNFKRGPKPHPAAARKRAELLAAERAAEPA